MITCRPFSLVKVERQVWKNVHKELQSGAVLGIRSSGKEYEVGVILKRRFFG